MSSLFSIIPIFMAVFVIIFIVIVITSFRSMKPKNIINDINKVGNIIQDAIDPLSDNTPCFLNNRESVCVPEILKDFPDFNVTLLYSDTREALRAKLKDKEELKIHQVVIADYKRADFDKTIILQAALQYSEGCFTVQKKYNILYTYHIEHKNSVLTACPHCGAPLSGLSYDSVCPYCDSKIINPLDGTWNFNEIYEE